MARPVAGRGRARGSAWSFAVSPPRQVCGVGLRRISYATRTQGADSRADGLVGLRHAEVGAARGTHTIGAGDLTGFADGHRKRQRQLKRVIIAGVTLKRRIRGTVWCRLAGARRSRTLRIRST